MQPGVKIQTISHSPEQTTKLGETLGRLLESGDVVALVGELGSGKTVFAQGLARGLGVGPDEYVSSPSFTLVNQYKGRFPIFHVDTYRLGTEAEMVSLGYEEYFDPNGVTIIEWADKVRGLLPERYIVVRFKLRGRETREIDVELTGQWPPDSQQRIAEALSERPERNSVSPKRQ
ncbi:MAG: tRNA (adenosine(37)-N6)-threonylcarbamoyltransferase complex ATPase subunit type 1 TsaE [Candidatus Lindowbacteria bacterium]|nr:tRNA (adenosine(37)-N6)-threonylcarbamoyltransferase complex ATPase subunit type 1 TsaE [Candidatus Lindowbacteria bacterium]